MAERKQVNKYYPPDWDPSKGSVNKHVGQHPLRERARKLSQGILIIRFEMPYNIWCGGCGNHIGMGVRYNAEKKKVGNYYTTPIYKFRMKCHLCDNYIEIENDPKSCDYTIVAGARRKEERWDPVAAENVIATDHAEKQKLIDDAMFKLEHGEKDKRKSKAAIPGLVQIKDMQTQWKDDFAINQMLRKKFRQEKKVIVEQEEKDQEIKEKGGLDLDLVHENPDDIKRAKSIRFRAEGYEEEKRKRRLQIKSRPMFSETSGKNNRRADLLEKRRKMTLPTSTNALTTIFTKNNEDFGVRRKTGGALKEKKCSENVTGDTLECSILHPGENVTKKCTSKTNLETAENKVEYKEGIECPKSNKESHKEKTNHSLEERTFEQSAISELNKDVSRLDCDVQLDVSSEMARRNKPLTVHESCEKGSEDRGNIEQNKTSNVNSTDQGNVCLSTMPAFSLVSEMYSDTDSDSSK